MKPRLLILTAGYGEGHNAAARALAAACAALHGEGAARVADAFALAAPRTNALSRRAYLGLINRAPGAWRAIYAWVDRSRTFPRLLRLLRGERRVLERLVRETQPTAICSTYPIYAFLLDGLLGDGTGRDGSGRRRVPHYNVVTDSISLNSIWWQAPCDGWFLPNDDSAAVLRAAGVAPGALHVSGFPVAPFFGAQAAVLRPPNLATSRPRVLYVINSGTPGAAKTARRLLAESDWDITCAVSRNEPLRRELATLAARRQASATILGWTDQIPRLLMTHHVVVSKAGGATTQEALAARCPMLVNQIVPGQEEGNYELLRRHGIGALAETPDAVLRELRRAFADQGRVWRAWRVALEPLVRPHAARDIVDHITRPAGPAAAAAPIAFVPAAVSAADRRCSA